MKNKTMKQKITITIDEAVAQRIETARGLIPRSTFIEQILLKNEKKERSSPSHHQGGKPS